MAVIPANITANPTLSEVAVALRVNGGKFEHMTRADALAAARERCVPLKDGRVMKGHIGVIEIAMGHTQRMNTPGVRVGQVWASIDKRDIRLGARQHRTVTKVHTLNNNGKRVAFLETRGSRLTGSFAVQLKKHADGSEYIDRHRLVHP